MLGDVLNSLGLVVYFDYDMYLFGCKLDIGQFDWVLEYVLFEPVSRCYFGVLVDSLLVDTYCSFGINSFCNVLILTPSCDILHSFNP